VPKAAKVATRYCCDLALAVLPSLRSIFMDVAGFVATKAKGGKSATSNTEADADFFATESGSRDKDDGAFDGSAFATMALMPALAPRPRPRRIARHRRQIVNRKSRFIAMLEAALAKKAATLALKPESSQASKFISGRKGRSAKAGAATGRLAPDFIAFVVGGLSKFSRASPEPSEDDRPAKKNNDHKIRRDFNHPKPPKPG